MASPAERGGAALLAAFLLLVLMAGVTLATGRNVLRDLVMESDGGSAAGADAAAESGLAWFLAWAAEDPEALRTFLAALEAEPPGTPAAPPGEPGRGWAPEGDPLDQAFRLTLRRLGAWPEPEAAGPPRQAWRITSTGTCRARAPGAPPVFTQVRELWCLAPPAGVPAPGGGPSGPDLPHPWALEVLARHPVHR
jgi:hypothetical protein